ncbi:hypothetical protein H5T58_02230 [Candidatus Parcubacteria bacterium]|nr:hypothetical protein [Candidatus Parcubacteria bacterium]
MEEQKLKKSDFSFWVTVISILIVGLLVVILGLQFWYKKSAKEGGPFVSPVSRTTPTPLETSPETSTNELLEELEKIEIPSAQEDLQSIDQDINSL